VKIFATALVKSGTVWERWRQQLCGSWQ